MSRHAAGAASSDLSDRGRGCPAEDAGWSPARWRERARRALAANGREVRRQDAREPASSPEVIAARAAWLAQAAADAFAALQAPDPELDAERAVMAGGQ